MILSTKKNKCLLKYDCSDIVFDDEYDVIVAGLGTAGSLAAITAAQKRGGRL